MHRIRCSEIWGGIKNEDLDVCSAGLCASLYSGARGGDQGGDAYYFSVCGSDMLTRLALADVCGHGAAVSEISTWVYDSLAKYMNELDQPAMMGGLNDLVAGRGFKALTTAVMVSYYTRTGKLYYTCAGHPPMLSRGLDGRWREVSLPDSHDPRNMPLGVMPGIGYDMRELSYHPGDQLLLYSDGIIEAPSPDGELFGSQRLVAALDELDAAAPMELKESLLGRIRDWTGGSLAHDDVTVVAIQLE